MPKILKSSNIVIDSDNKISIAVTDPSVFLQRVKIEHEDQLVDSDEPVEDIAEDILQRAHIEAEMIRNKASLDAQTIIDDAKEHADEVAQEIYESNRTKGYEEGFANGQAEADKLIHQAKQILDDATREREAMLNTAEPELIELVTKIVKKLLFIEADINPQIILNLIKRGIAGATLTGNVIVHVSPDDYDTVMQNKDIILADMDTMSKLEIVNDLSLNKSDCVIETTYGNIDSSLEQQFNLLKKDLLYILDTRVKYGG